MEGEPMKHSKEIRKNIRQTAAARTDRDAVNLDSSENVNNEYVDKMNMSNIKNNDNMKPEVNNDVDGWKSDTNKKMPDNRSISGINRDNDEKTAIRNAKSDKNMNVEFS